MDSESDLFLDPIRSQLNATPDAPCTYFSTYNDKRVFVKGPFATVDEAAVAKTVTTFKSTTCPDISIADVDIVECIPDSMSDCQFGRRTTIIGDTTCAFQVMSGDGVTLGAVEVLPTKMRSSPNAWPKPVTVVNWTDIDDNYCHVEYNKSYSKCIYKTDKRAAREFVKHILLSWVCGAAAATDMVFSNFIHDKGAHKVYQVSHDDWMNFDCALSNTQVASGTTKAWAHFKKFITSDKTHFDKFFKSALARVPDGPIKERMSAVVDDWTVVQNVMVVEAVVEEAVVAVEPDVEPTQKRPREVDNDPVPVPTPTPAPKKVKVDVPEYTLDGVYIGKSTHVGVDPWGVETEVRKNALQKAIQTGNVDQALISFFACYNVTHIHRNEEDAKAAKAARDDILNHVVICALEDVGVANIELVMMVVEQLDRVVTNDKSTMHPFAIAALIYNLCISQKTRIQMHLPHVFHPKNSIMAMEAGVDWVSDIPQHSGDGGWFNVAASDPERVWRSIGRRHPLLHQVYKRMPEIAVIRFALTVEYFKYKGVIVSEDRKQQFVFHETKLKLNNLSDIAHNKVSPEDYVTSTTRVSNEATLFRYLKYKKIYENSRIPAL